MSLGMFLNISKIILFSLVVVGVILYCFKLIDYLFVFSPVIKHKKSEKYAKFAVIIPARDESKVVNGILSALKKQDYPESAFNVYVITEKDTDPTNAIVKEYGFNVVVRKHLELKGKGHAMNECISELYAENEKYDGFIIFDADNIPNSNFISEMNNALQSGYDIGLGYRNSKNWNDGWIASCSALTFSKINTVQNKARKHLKMNCLVSGTGYYVKESVLAPFKGWPFNTLTEDAEISTYATIHNLKTTYVETAEYFDEQPVEFNTSFNQRVRWVKGYSQVHAKYDKKLFSSMLKDRKNIASKIEMVLGVIPLILIIVGLIVNLLLMVAGVVWGIISSNPLLFECIKNIMIEIIICYFVFVLDAVIMLLAEGKRINLTFKNKIVCCLMNPIYWLLYIPCALKAIFTKNVEWKKIEHNVTEFKKD